MNDRRILEEVLDGAVDCEQVAQRCGAGSRCGGCRPTIAALLASLGLAEQPVSVTSLVD
ncbi:MAG: (2Fe-2S)-binding protein [Actinomycetota bacterium]|nr:(2Fe-2S)-binding protein [Actinomycetota bacterium]